MVEDFGQLTDKLLVQGTNSLMWFCHNMVSLIVLLFFSKVWDKIVSCAKGFYFWGVGVREVWCGEQRVALMATPSGYQQFATEPTAILPSVAARLPKRLQVTLDLQLINQRGFETTVKVEESVLTSLQELDVFLDELLDSSSHSQDERNESESASGIKLVEPVPHLTVSILLSSWHERKHHWIDRNFLDTLLKIVLKFRTKLHVAFSTTYVSARLLQTAIDWNDLELVKLVVAIEPLRISNNSCLCPATVVAKVMKCECLLELITFLFEVCGNPQFDQPDLLQIMLDDLNSLFWTPRRKSQYVDLFLKHVGTLSHLGEKFIWHPKFLTDKTYDTMQSYGHVSNSYHKIQTLPGVWNLTAEVHGLLPRTRRARLHQQVLKLQVSLQPVVTGACSMAIRVQNVHVKIENVSLDSSPSNVLGFFLSHITVSIRPEVEEQQVLLVQLDVSSPNEPYDISATRTIGISATATGSNNPGVAVTATESSSATIKSTTTDWRHEQTRGDQFTGTFSWTLRRLAGVPFDYAQPKCTKVPTRMSIFRRRPVTSILELPFNSDGSVTFSEQCPKTIKWTLAPELAGTDVAWYVSTTVYVNMLDRSTGEGKTLEFWSPHYLLHNMSKDVECTHS
jgi:hypothetical protein